MDRRTLARPYARAFYRHARECGRVPEWETFLAAGGMAIADRRVGAFLDDPRIGTGDKVEFLARLLDVTAADPRRRAIHILLDHRRYSLLAAIADEFHALRARDEGWIDVVVRTARWSDPPLPEGLHRALEQRFLAQLRLTVRRDPALLAGAEIRVGDTVIDVSLRGRLATLGARVS